MVRYVVAIPKELVDRLFGEMASKLPGNASMGEFKEKISSMVTEILKELERDSRLTQIINQYGPRILESLNRRLANQQNLTEFNNNRQKALNDMGVSFNKALVDVLRAILKK